MNNLINVMLVFGTRPEAIKMAPLINEFKKFSANFKVKVCVTGQHREMLDQILNLFEINPDYDLRIMKNGQDLFDISSRIILGMRDVLSKENPDLLFVHGDTTTSSAVALAGFYKKIPIAHVEAGLRTNNIYSPWPEEINRQLISRIATYHFAPTPRAKNNLTNENISEKQIVITGNTVIDALKNIVEKIELDSSVNIKLAQYIKNEGYDLNRLSTGRRLVLITGHRRENFGDGLLNICNSIRRLSELYPKVDFVYPVHLNPNVQTPVSKILGNDEKIGNIFLLKPMDYLPFVYMMQKSFLVLTDSGGIQEEAPSLGKPVLVMRESTERPEAIDAGTAKLVGNSSSKIISSVAKLLDDEAEYKIMSSAINPYGDGSASNKIIQTFIKKLKFSN